MERIIRKPLYKFALTSYMSLCRSIYPRYNVLGLMELSIPTRATTKLSCDVPCDVICSQKRTLETISVPMLCINVNFIPQIQFKPKPILLQLLPSNQQLSILILVPRIYIYQVSTTTKTILKISRLLQGSVVIPDIVSLDS